MTHISGKQRQHEQGKKKTQGAWNLDTMEDDGKLAPNTPPRKDLMLQT